MLKWGSDFSILPIFSMILGMAECLWYIVSHTCIHIYVNIYLVEISCLANMHFLPTIAYFVMVKCAGTKTIRNMQHKYCISDNRTLENRCSTRRIKLH